MRPQIDRLDRTNRELRSHAIRCEWSAQVVDSLRTEWVRDRLDIVSNAKRSIRCSQDLASNQSIDSLPIRKMSMPDHGKRIDKKKKMIKKLKTELASQSTEITSLKSQQREKDDTIICLKQTSQ